MAPRSLSPVRAGPRARGARFRVPSACATEVYALGVVAPPREFEQPGGARAASPSALASVRHRSGRACRPPQPHRTAPARRDCGSRACSRDQPRSFAGALKLRTRAQAREGTPCRRSARARLLRVPPEAPSPRHGSRSVARVRTRRSSRRSRARRARHRSSTAGSRRKPRACRRAHAPSRPRAAPTGERSPRTRPRTRRASRSCIRR